MTGNEQINPAWNEILSKIPEALHSVVVPALQKWDAGVTQKFQEIHEQYKPLKGYQSLADHGIDPEYAINAITLADRIEKNPKQIVDQINQAFKLEYVSPEDAAKLGQGKSPQGDPDDSFFDNNEADITKHPQFKMLADQIKSFQEQFEQTNQKQEQDRQIAEFEDYLDDLETETKGKNLPFSRRYVTALMTQGMSGEDAVKQYHEELALPAVTDPANNPPNPPAIDNDLIVMGQEGSTGGGTPDGSIKMGDLSKNQTNDLVQELLEKQLGSGQ